ncbi:DUF3833 family protein [Sphingomonas sp. 28-62-20]|uniref:DUF3833 family protein n=1 Tax=Sphingomonas sp. 28-62-20 TaxID=1970433 RepID=UPI0035A82F33
MPILALALAGCVATPRIGPVAAAPAFVPNDFFSGRSEGTASLKVIFRSAVPVRVESLGSINADGALVLDQTVFEGDKPPRQRHWLIRRTGPNRYAGTLSDATSPVIGEVTGNRLHLGFGMKGGMHAQQWLTLAPDGQSAHNIMVVRKFGLTLAVLDETIRKIDPAG